MSRVINSGKTLSCRAIFDYKNKAKEKKSALTTAILSEQLGGKHHHIVLIWWIHISGGTKGVPLPDNAWIIVPVAVGLYRIKKKGAFMQHTIGLESHFRLRPRYTHQITPDRRGFERRGGWRGRLGEKEGEKERGRSEWETTICCWRQTCNPKGKRKNLGEKINWDDSIGLSQVMSPYQRYAVSHSKYKHQFLLIIVNNPR